MFVRCFLILTNGIFRYNYSGSLYHYIEESHGVPFSLFGKLDCSKMICICINYNSK